MRRPRTARARQRDHDDDGRTRYGRAGSDAARALGIEAERITHTAARVRKLADQAEAGA
ncbi:hypothetical protein [Streptomyces sp. NPDC058240]|uniref:hypothetical protein n=1 Tax=Streptomyces sp. NPDC058240 TaxID=3346396 RepID=UPI0036EACD73